MTNAEYFLKEGVDINKLSQEFGEFINENYGLIIGNKYGLAKFWEKSCKPTLTEDERVILEFIKNFDYIGRDKKGLYYKLQDEDIKEKTAVIYNLTTNLFQFIKERRRI